MWYLRSFLILSLAISLFACQSDNSDPDNTSAEPAAETVEKTDTPNTAPPAGVQESAEAFFDRLLPVLQDGTPDQLFALFVNKEQLYSVALLQAPPKEKVISEMGGEAAWEQYQNQIRQQVDMAWDAIQADKQKIYNTFTSVDWNTAIVQNVQLRKNANQFFTSQTEKLDHLGIVVIDTADDSGQITSMEIPVLRDESGKWLIVNPPQIK